MDIFYGHYLITLSGQKDTVNARYYSRRLYDAKANAKGISEVVLWGDRLKWCRFVVTQSGLW